MPVWDRDKIRSSLTSKGFSLVGDRDHDVLTLEADGLTRAIWTKLSRGNKHRVYGNPLLGAMSGQLKVTRRQLDQLIECTMGGPEYLAHLRDTGIIRG
jgi:hypothetical protein